MITLKVRGLPELNRQLQALPENLHKKLLRGALAAGAQVILAEALQRVPRRSGALASTLRVSVRDHEGKVTATVSSGRRGKGGVFYSHMVEGGTKRHYISVAGSGSAAARLNRRFKKRGLAIAPGRFVSSVIHPGARARPFLKPALEAGAERAVEAAAQYLREHLPEALTP